MAFFFFGLICLVLGSYGCTFFPKYSPRVAVLEKRSYKLQPRRVSNVNGLKRAREPAVRNRAES